MSFFSGGEVLRLGRQGEYVVRRYVAGAAVKEAKQDFLMRFVKGAKRGRDQMALELWPLCVCDWKVPLTAAIHDSIAVPACSAKQSNLDLSLSRPFLPLILFYSSLNNLLRRALGVFLTPTQTRFSRPILNFSHVRVPAAAGSNATSQQRN